MENGVKKSDEPSSEVKLQDTEVNMDFEGLEGQNVDGAKGSRVMVIALVGFILIVLVGIAYAYIQSMDDNSGRQQLKNSSNK